MSRDNIHKTTLNGKPLGSRLDLTMVGDWGTANFHTIWGWVSAHLRWRSAPLSKFTIRTGSAYRDSVDLVGMGEADLAVTTPIHIGVRWAREGKHFYEGTPYPNLRTLGHLPQDDRLTLAVRADTGIKSFADIREKKPALHIAMPPRADDCLCSYVIDLIFKAHGINTNRPNALYRRALACVSLPTCALALTEAERNFPHVIRDINTLVEKYNLMDRAPLVRMTGCPNGCGRPYSAEIGIVGQQNGGKYAIFLGGNYAGTKVGEAVLQKIQMNDLPAQLDKAFALWSKESQPQERFGDFVARVGLERIKSVFTA